MHDDDTVPLTPEEKSEIQEGLREEHSESQNGEAMPGSGVLADS